MLMSDTLGFALSNEARVGKRLISCKLHLPRQFTHGPPKLNLRSFTLICTDSYT